MLPFKLFQLFTAVLFLFPYRWRKTFFIALSNLVYRFDAKHKKVIRQNLGFAFDAPLEEREIQNISKACYNNAAIAFSQVIENHALILEDLKQRVTFTHLDIVQHALQDKRPIIFVTAHYGNWEIAGAAISNFITPITVIYRKLNNPYFDRYLYESRLKAGINTVEKSGAVRAIAKLLKSGKAVTLLTDQNTDKRDGVAVNFFGKPVHQTTTPAFLARKYNAIIIPLYTTTEDFEHYTITFSEAIEVARTDDTDADILEATQKQALLHEKAIRERPDLWFWCHRRWKKDYPEIYKG